MPAQRVLDTRISTLAPRIKHAVHANELRTLEVQLRCKRGKFDRLIKVSSVTNKLISVEEMNQWSILMRRFCMDPELVLDGLHRLSNDIVRSKQIHYDEARVTRILNSKPMIEFGAQKQSRKALEVQCAVTQMDISSIDKSDVCVANDRPATGHALNSLHRGLFYFFYYRTSWHGLARHGPRRPQAQPSAIALSA